jgi:hypothetical protein
MLIVAFLVAGAVLSFTDRATLDQVRPDVLWAAAEQRDDDCAYGSLKTWPVFFGCVARERRAYPGSEMFGTPWEQELATEGLDQHCSRAREDDPPHVPGWIQDVIGFPDKVWCLTKITFHAGPVGIAVFLVPLLVILLVAPLQLRQVGTWVDFAQGSLGPATLAYLVLAFAIWALIAIPSSYRGGEESDEPALTPAEREYREQVAEALEEIDNAYENVRDALQAEASGRSPQAEQLSQAAADITAVTGWVRSLSVPPCLHGPHQTLLRAMDAYDTGAQQLPALAERLRRERDRPDRSRLYGELVESVLLGSELTRAALVRLDAVAQMSAARGCDGSADGHTVEIEWTGVSMLDPDDGPERCSRRFSMACGSYTGPGGRGGVARIQKTEPRPASRASTVKPTG